MINERQDWLDIASGIMVSWMMLFHALYPMLQSNVLKTIPVLYFFMPWFFYKSGMMFTDRDLKTLFKKDSEKFIRTFLIWSFIGYIFHIFWHWFFYKDLSLRMAFYSPLRSMFLIASVPMNSALWFIPILFCVRQIFNYLIKKISAWFILIISYGVTIVIILIDIPYIPAWISSTAWGMTVFSAAYILKDFADNHIVLTICAIVLFWSYFTNIPATYDDTGTDVESLLWYPCSIAGCIIFNHFIRKIVYLTKHITGSNQCLPIFSFIGRHSMVFYVSHYIVFKISFDALSILLPDCYSNVWGLLIVILLYAIVGLTIIFFQNRQKCQIN